MKKRTGRVGGFVARNSGEIDNCYSVVRLAAKGRNAGGFAGENSGAIGHSYSYCPLRGLTGGFAGAESGKSEIGCYFFHREKEGGKRLGKLVDSAKSQRLAEVKDDETAASLGFDTKTVWQYHEGDMPLRFVPENWLFDGKRTAGAKADGQKGPERAIAIHTADELFSITRKINKGDRQLASATIRLKADLDLGGKQWTPIGKSRACAFTGVFDGDGHTVSNFTIKNKEIENKGFFGFLKGEVYNLSVDCQISGGTCSGGIAAQNDGGTIGCCAAIVDIKGKNGSFGGLVGHNAGTIFECYAAGKIAAAAVPWWWALLLLVPMVAFLIVYISGKPLQTFAPVPYDEDQVPIEEEHVTPNTDGHFVSFQFEQKIDVNLTTGLCSFGFKNPGNSNHNIVVQLQFTDAQATRVMGSTGRTKEEQKKLEATKGYDADTYRTTLAKSGAIRPGYQLKDLQLIKQPNGAALPPGSYNAMVYLVFYDVKTNNRAMLESQLPVVISVHK